MKNTSVKNYLKSINSLGENIIKDIKLSTYTDDLACYSVKYFDIELAKNRMKLITIRLIDYHHFCKQDIRKQKLEQLKIY